MTRAWGYAFFKYNLTTVPERRTPLLVSLTGKNFLPEEVGAMLLKEAVKDFAGEAAGQAGGPRVAVAVPPQWTQRRRQALIDACNIAGLNLTSIISDHAAAALQYGVEQPLRKGERRRTVLIVGLGATSGYAAIVRYSAYTAKVNPGGRGRPSAAVSVPYIAVKRIAWEEGVGGWHMDALLAKHLAGQAEAGGACSAAPSPAGGCIGPRAMSRLLAAARKAREVLSVNTEAAAQVTDLVPGRDFSTTVTRAQFEDLAREIVERAAKPAARVLRSYPAGIDAIELVGGASRTPLFQALLRQAVSAATGRDLPLGRHVNTDEAVALGAALRAANVTAAVKDGRAPPRAALQDISPFTLGAAGSAELVRAGGAIPASRTVSIANVTRDLEITIDTLIGTAEPSPEESVAFKVRGVAEAAARAAGKRGKGRGGGRAAAAPSVDVELRLSVSRSGIAAVDKVFAHRGKSFREVLEVQPQAEGSPRLDPEQLRRSKLLLKEIERAEARRAAADEWRSSLEGLLFEVQTELDESEALRTLSNSAGKQDAIENFQAPELWSQCSDTFPQEDEPLLERTSLSRAGSALEQEIRLTEQWLWEVDEAGVALKVAEFEAKAQKLRESRDQFREAKRLASQTGSEDLQSYTATDEDLYSKLEIRELREKLEAVEQRVQNLENALQQCVSNKPGS
eukprot:CAMPEP_0177595444 /NCGR_PEP_ID=MMETSP0419_2-20121207/10358_1 /TAXON_ID=582737 /ORGANISM="Tetraselmis sp., Strain GSL018" /LENGTH=680 /DNA_ID=CAMNT_0019086901 /DNA_START=343 /DNA_END=2386 /DNA_ORIENTATION=+